MSEVARGGTVDPVSRGKILTNEDCSADHKQGLDVQLKQTSRIDSKHTRLIPNLLTAITTHRRQEGVDF